MLQLKTNQEVCLLQLEQCNGWVVDISKSRMAGKMPLDRYFYTHCRIDSFCVLRQSFCGKFKIFCGFRNPQNPLFRMYGGWPTGGLATDGSQASSYDLE